MGDAQRPPQRTIMGGMAPVVAGPASGAAPSQKTLMGMAAPFGPAPAAPPSSAGPDGFTRTQVIGTPAGKASSFDPLTDPDRAIATVVDVPAFAGLPEAPAAGSQSQQRTLLGVARPGIAPLRPGVQKTPIDDEEPPPSYAPLEELGATMRISPHLVGRELERAGRDRVDARKPAPPDSGRGGKHPLGQRRLEKVPAKEIKRIAAQQAARSRRGLYILCAAIGIAATAVVVALLWPSPPPIRAQVRAGEGGAEILDLTCEACPDGTVLKLRDGEGTVQGGKASIQLPAPLAIGDTAVRVAIDRPASGRDESVTLPVRVAYRIRPELGTLDGDKPSIQIVVDAMEGSLVTLDGEDVPLRDGRAAKSIDVSKEITGTSNDPAAQLSRKVSFTVTPPDGVEEKGAVAVTAPILPLALAAPGRAVVTDRSTFVLAGQTLPGAEIVVAGRSIGVTKDGAFNQTMNVSSVGTTQVEVRARMAGRAPRIVRFGVTRVTSLETAAADFMKESPLGYGALLDDPAAAQGKPVAISGEVVEARVQGAATLMVVQVSSPACKTPPAPSGDKTCLVRLMQGRSDLGAQRGSAIRAYGTAVGTVAHEGATLPDIDVSFSIIAESQTPRAPEPP